MTMIWCCQSLRSTIGSPGDPCDWRHIPAAPPGSTPPGMPRGALLRVLRHSTRAFFASPLPREQLFGDRTERRAGWTAMCSATHVVPDPAPAGWNPRTAIGMVFPEIVELARSADHEIRTIAAELDRREARGRDTSCPRQILRELRWRLEYSADTSAIRATLARL